MADTVCTDFFGNTFTLKEKEENLEASKYKLEDLDIPCCLWFIEHSDGTRSRCENERHNDFFCENHFDKRSAPQKKEQILKETGLNRNKLA